MADQLGLVFPMARARDPETSHQAAARHEKKLSLRRAEVLLLVAESPGLTSGELSRRMFERHPHLSIRRCAETPHKRLPELERLGLVRRGQPRECIDSRYKAVTWWPT